MHLSLDLKGLVPIRAVTDTHTHKHTDTHTQTHRHTNTQTQYTHTMSTRTTCTQAMNSTERTHIEHTPPTPRNS